MTMRRLTLFALAALAVTVVSCSRQAADETPALPASTPLSPDGVRHEQHSFSPDGTRVAYWSPATDSQNWQLWVANADLTAPVKLPVTAIAVNRAIWSPDGTMLAAGSADFGVAQVVIVPAAGGAVRRVTDGSNLTFPVAWFGTGNGTGLSYYGSAPGGSLQSFLYTLSSSAHRPLVPAENRPFLGVASPDGSKVAYFVIDGEKSTLWIADGNGQNSRQLTTEGFESLEQGEEFSPDGKELLYQSRRTGHVDLWIQPIDGSKPRQLTRDIRGDFFGAWSKDGKWIAFLSNRGRQTDVWIVPAAGGVEQRVTDSEIDEVGPLSWGAGGNTLTFGVRTQKNSVWAMDLATGQEQQLTQNSMRTSRFRVSPDGSQLLYAIDKPGGVQDLAVAPVAGGDTRILIDGGGSVVAPEWSPNGKQIAFWSDRGGTADIWIVDVAGGAPRQLTNWPGYEGTATWTHDGSAIYFTSDKDSKLNDIWRVSPAGGEPVRVTTTGNINGGMSMLKGGLGLVAGTISTKGGQLALSRYGPDGTSNVVWDKSTAIGAMPSPTGDSVIAEVEQPGGKLQTMLLKTDGSGGRVLLPPEQTSLWWSSDGKWLVYSLSSGGATDLGMMNLADGTTRRLTTTPQSEEGAELTADGKTLIFRRVETVHRITAVDLSKLLAAKK